MVANDTLPVTGWYSPPNVRGTFDILKTCLGTIFLLCWSSVCPNIPSEQGGFRARFAAEFCEEGAMEEGAQEDAEEGTQHLATHVFILAHSLLYNLCFLNPSDCLINSSCSTRSTWPRFYLYARTGPG